ncbi:MAG: T9SS type A sorting domain-containing protein [Prevotella sp.]|nr:T9SS type A sorting domain-containing protein [Prevotella sp.]
MNKSLLICSLSLTMLLFVPSVAGAVMVAPGIEQVLDDDTNILVSGQSVLVTGGQGQTLEVVSLTGRRVMAVKIETPSQKVELNIPKGCYILKIGKIVRKVSIH